MTTAATGVFITPFSLRFRIYSEQPGKNARQSEIELRCRFYVLQVHPVGRAHYPRSVAVKVRSQAGQRQMFPLAISVIASRTSWKTTMTRKRSSKQEEQLAKRIVEQVQPSLSLRHNLDQFLSVADFAIRQHGEEVGVLEVTRATNRNQEQIFSTLQDRPLLPRQYCCKDWLIALKPSKQLQRREISEKADRYLHELENVGITRFFYPTQRNVPYVTKIHDELNVHYGFQVETRTPGVAIMTTQTYKNSKGINDSVEVEANKPDNLHKLNKPQLSLRHIFVFIDVFNGPSYFAMLNAEMPEYPPKLPCIITHAWAVAVRGQDLLVWHTDRTRWYNLTNQIQNADPSLPI